MSNQRKAELVSDNFGIQSFQGSHGKISPRARLMAKGPVYPEFSISSTRPCSDSRNSEITDCLESENEPSESGESEFQFSLGLKFGFFPSCCSVKNRFQ
jgi:hypothetical protein